jgi:hypothetical protein
MNLEPSSDMSLHLAQNRMQQCNPTCSKSSRAFTPTRLVEIRSPDSCRIVEPIRGKPVIYAALSYSWGGTEEFSLTNARYTEFLLGFPVNRLPSALKDSILIVRSLGFSHIFIDSLCIIQDKSEDVGKQIGLMPLIYSCADITIIASRSNGVREGFLHRRALLGSKPNDEVFSAVLTQTKGRAYPIILIPSSVDADDGSNEPLSNRAWAFQERILSSRILDYGSRCTRWICSHGHCQDMIDGWKMPDQVLDHSGYNKALTQTRRILESTTKGNDVSEPAATKEQIWKVWIGLIRLYTTLNITVPTDRLPAISALADRFSVLLKSRYLAGLWEDFLAYELLWATELARGPRTKLYQGPSWSWAAVKDAVSFLDAPKSMPLDRGFHIVSCAAPPLHAEAAFGEVRFASLTLRGRTRTGIWTREINPSDGNSTPLVEFDDSAEDNGIDIYQDTTAEDFEIASGSSAVAVLLIVIAVKTGRKGQLKRILGLVLYCRRSGKYLRVARFHLSYGHGVDPVKWLDRSVVEKATII